MGEFAFWIFVTIMVILFWGEPDLHDKLLEHYTTSDECAQVEIYENER